MDIVKGITAPFGTEETVAKNVVQGTAIAYAAIGLAVGYLVFKKKGEA